MATYTFHKATHTRKSLVKPEVWRFEVKFADQNVANGDIVKALSIPADTVVITAWLRVKKAATSGTKANLGYASDRDRWGAWVPLTTVGQETPVDLETNAGVVERSLIGGQPIHLTSATTIDLQMVASSAVTKGTVEVCALVVRLK